MTDEKRNAMRTMAKLVDGIMATANMFKDYLEHPEKAPENLSRDFIKGMAVAYQHDLMDARDAYHEMFSIEDFNELYN